MGYETKVILTAILDIIQSSKTVDEAFRRVAKIANAEGITVAEPEDREENGS